MKRSLVALFLCVGLLLTLAGCAPVAQASLEAPNATEDDPGSYKALFRERYDTAFALAQHYVCNSSAENRSMSVTDENGMIWSTCDHYSSIEELKTATLEVFTENKAAAFFKVAFDEETPAYKEEGGILWQNRDYLFDVSPWLAGTLTWEGKTIECMQWDTLALVSEEEDTRVYTIDFYWCYPDDPTTVWFELARQDGTWRFDHYFEEMPVTDDGGLLVKPYARAYIEDIIAAENCNIQGTYTEPGYKFIDSELLSIVKRAEFSDLADAVIELYAFDFRLLADHPDQVALAGGRRLDEEGWLHGVQWDQPYFIVANEKGSLTYLGSQYFEGETGSVNFRSELTAWLEGCASSGQISVPGARAALEQCAQAYFQETADQIGYTIRDSKITSLDFVDRYTDIATEYPVEVYAMDYWIKPDQAGQAYYNGMLDSENRLVIHGAADVTPAFYLVVSHMGADFGYIGVVDAQRAAASGNLKKAVTESVFGVNDLEFTLFKQGYWGLGGSGFHFMSGVPVEKKLESSVYWPDGSYYCEESWNGLTIRSFVSPASKIKSVYYIKTTLKDLPTYRGIEVGDSREDVLRAYPEIQPEHFPAEEWGDQLVYESIPGAICGYFLHFYFENDIVVSIMIENMFD